jgi:hypothetical protein
MPLSENIICGALEDTPGRDVSAGSAGAAPVVRVEKRR